jgi:hypothetical protein
MRNALTALSIGTLVATAFAGAAAAQESVIERCRKAANDAERIACLEGALVEKSAAAAGPPEDTVLPARQPGESDALPRMEQEEDIGARQVQLRNRSGADLEASLESARGLRVARYSEVPYRRLQVELENGQVWRQIVGDTQRLTVDPQRNQTVDINESGISGYKLRLNELERTIRVERIR